MKNPKQSHPCGMAKVDMGWQGDIEDQDSSPAGHNGRAQGGIDL